MQIGEKELKDGIITNAKVKAAAGIATSKLADALNFILRTGAVAFTADQPMGGFKITGLGNGASAGDAINKSQLDAAIAGVVTPFQFPDEARLAATANINIANPGTDTFDGIVASNGDRIWLPVQSSAPARGIYIFNGSGVAMTRATDMNTWEEVSGAFFAVLEGATHGGSLWFVNVADGGTLDTTAITSIKIPITPGLLAVNFIKETPAGDVDGVNVTFTLANSPVTGTVDLYTNGLLELAGTHYTISGLTITYTVAPEVGDIVRANYIKA